MIFTIGNKQSYSQYFSEQESPEKLGRTEDYCGGSVWQTKEQAEKHCPPGYSIYGVLADWETQTVPSKNGTWNDLIFTSLLVQL